MNRRMVAAALVSLLVVALSADGLSAATDRVRATERDRWRPVHTYIGVGDRVLWRNPTDDRHDLTAYGRGWEFRRVLDPGERAARRFRDAGTFRYRCRIHSSIVDGRCEGMCGLIHVFEE